jgi:hypothetical protein
LLDGAAATDYAGTFTVSANGSHSWAAPPTAREDAKAFALTGAAPLIAITAPAADASYLRGSHIPAACTDQGSGVSSCAGPVASGHDFDTTTLGVKTFTVDSARAASPPPRQ